MRIKIGMVAFVVLILTAAWGVAEKSHDADALVAKFSKLSPMEFIILGGTAMEDGVSADLMQVIREAKPETREAFFKNLPPGVVNQLQMMMEGLPPATDEIIHNAVKTCEKLLANLDTPLVRARIRVSAKQYAEALPLYEDAFKAGAPDEMEYYNAACAGALAGNKEFAFKYLGKALEAGLLDEETVKSDTDLESLRTEPGWEALLGKIKAREVELVNSLPEKHPENTVVELPAPKLDGSYSVEKALQARRSVREYAAAPLSLEEVSQLLWAAYGVTKKVEKGPAFLRGGLKTAASAGALYPLEVYLVAGKVTGLPPGVYLYRSESHSLLKIKDGDLRDKLCQASLGQAMVRNAPVSLVYSAVFERTTRKYGTRGKERYVCMDLGHSGQNVYLQATAMKMGTCAIGAFLDLRLRLTVGMTRPETPLYVMPVGKLKE